MKKMEICKSKQNLYKPGTFFVNPDDDDVYILIKTSNLGWWVCHRLRDGERWAFPEFEQDLAIEGLIPLDGMLTIEQNVR